MSKEKAVPPFELEHVAQALTATFIQRRDLYARQQADGRYFCVRRPLLSRHMAAHLRGEITLGAYVLDRFSRARYLVLDADSELEWGALLDMAADLDDQDIPVYLETSRRGGHLWLFFPRSVAGREARQFGQGLLATYSLPKLELFPKQDRLREGPGSLIRIPFGIHRRTGQRYRFIDLHERSLGGSWLAQIQLLCAPQTVPEPAFHHFQGLAAKRGQKPVLRSPALSEVPLSQRLKAHISVLDFVSQYVELAPNGRGLCPFHDDRHASFGVNVEQNYWHCFAGCGGGSVIDFWMKWQACDFKTAVKELDRKLL